MEIKIKNNTLQLLALKAVYWKETKMLIISDLHLGKIAHFRKEGIALPSHAFIDNFRRLDQLLKTLKIHRVLFTGDLFHSSMNEEWHKFCSWRKRYAELPMEIVPGNHDRLALQCYDDAKVFIHGKEITFPPFTFAHHPKRSFKDNEYVIAGHIHPVIRLSGVANQTLRLPCFYFSKQQAILPSFGYFTGGHEIKPQRGDQVFVIAKDTIAEINYP